MDRIQEVATIKSLVGRTCIFKEKLLIRHVLASAVEVDDWGAQLRLDVLPTPGFLTELFPKLEVSASWEFIGISARAIGASYVSWLVVIRPDLVERIVAFAATRHTEHQLMEYVNKAAYGDEAP